MIEVKFTKGDWKVNSLVNGRGFDISFNDDGECIAEIIHIESDAHLIAAAPEMYKMLVELREAISSIDDSALGCVDDTLDRQGWYIKDETINSISNLLAKARGEK